MKSQIGWLGPVVMGFVLAAALPVSAATYEEHIALGKASYRLGSDKEDARALTEARKDFLAATEVDPDDPLAHYYLALTDWRLARRFTESGAGRDRIVQTVREGIERCDRVLAMDARHGEAMALKGSLLEILNEADSSYSPQLEHEARTHLTRARELSPGNPRVWLVSGITQLEGAPSRSGADEALREIQRALALFERETESLEILSGGTPSVGPGGNANPIDPMSETAPLVAPRTLASRPASLAPDWGHDEAWVWAGKAHMSQENYEAARRCFLNALEINPDIAEVKGVLLPEVEDALTPAGDAGRETTEGNASSRTNDRPSSGAPISASPYRN